MITVTVTHSDYTEPLAEIRITRVDRKGPESEYGDYLAEIGVDASLATGLHKRPIWSFPRTKSNALALVLAALDKLRDRPEVFELHGRTPDVARGRRRALPKIQRRSRRRSDN